MRQKLWLLLLASSVSGCATSPEIRHCIVGDAGLICSDGYKMPYEEAKKKNMDCHYPEEEAALLRFCKKQ